MSAKKEFLCQDVNLWLESTALIPGQAIVTSLPDISEFTHNQLDEWKIWFVAMAKALLAKTSPDDVVIFYQTDIKREGVWVDKAYLCLKAAEIVGASLLWHKVIARVPAGMTTFGKPSYSHILCFSKNLRLDTKNATPDIIPQMGQKTWARGMGENACHMIVDFLLKETKTQLLINPFCGEGLILAIAEQKGLASLGIDRSPKRIKKAQELSY